VTSHTVTNLGSDTVQWTPGTRLKSVVCETEIVIVRPPAAATAVIACGGRPMVAHGDDVARNQSILDGHGGGSILGKRYGREGDPVEVLVTKAGTGSLSLDGELMSTKDPKPLPSSD
jgi:hypothetical protein